MVRSRILNLVVKLSYVVFGAAVFSLWLTAIFHISSLCKGNSDGAFLVIAGNSVLKGNFLLRGYHLSLLDPFFPFDIYLNALFIKIFGFRPALSHIVPVFIFLILIAVSLLYVIEANKGRALKIGILMLFVFLALPVGDFAVWGLLEYHLSTVVLSLAAIFLINMFLKRHNYIYLICGFLILAVSLINDNLTMIISVIPLIAALFVFYKYKNGLKNKDSLFVIIAIIAVISSIPFKELMLSLITAAGGFKLVSGISPRFILLKYFQRNLYLFFSDILYLFDINFFGKKLYDVFTWINIAKLAGLGAVIYAAGIVVKKLKTAENSDFIDITLLFGIVVLVLAFLMSDLAANRASARYLIPAVVYGFILSSRNIPAIASKYYSSISFKLICAVIIIAYTVSFEYAAFTPIPVSPYRTLGNWFLKHNFTYGYGSYWDSGIVTLMTRGKIKVRQINASNYGKLVPYNWLSKNSWYKEKGVFVIYSKYKMYGGVDKSSIIKTFGKPSKIYTEYFQGVFNKVYGSYGTAAKNIMPPFIIKIYVYNKGIIIDGKNNMNVKYRKHRAGG